MSKLRSKVNRQFMSTLLVGSRQRDDIIAENSIESLNCCTKKNLLICNPQFYILIKMLTARRLIWLLVQTYQITQIYLYIP